MVANIAAELVWLRSLLFEIGIPHHRASQLWCDNVDVVYMTTNPNFHATMKHIEVYFHFVHDMVWRDHIKVEFVLSKNQMTNASPSHFLKITSITFSMLEGVK